MADSALVAVGAVAFAAATVFGWSALRAQRAHARWCESHTKAEGVVSRLVQRRVNGGLSEDAMGNSTSPTKATIPVVRFRALNGVEYEIDAPEVPHQVGAVVAIAYDPALPSGGRAVVRVPKIGCAVPLLIAGAILVAVGANLG